MAVANRSARLRRLAAKLTEHFSLEYARHEQIEAQYDNWGGGQEWHIEWADGPTVEQVRRAARKHDTEALDGVKFERHLSPRSYALGALRAITDPDAKKDALDRPRLYSWDIEELLRKHPKPRPRPGRETAMVDAILTEANGGNGPGWASPDDVCRLVAKKGPAHFLRRSGAEMTPIETLTDRYATGAAWADRLVTMPPLEAFSAVQTDPDARPQDVAAALTLVPDLHTAIDVAAAELANRPTAEGQQP